MIGDGSIKAADLSCVTPALLELEGKAPAHHGELAVGGQCAASRNEAAMLLRDPTVPQ
jgi:hypothetical protein